MDELLYDRVRIAVDASIAVVTLARSDAGNGFDLAMAHGLREAAQRVTRGAEDGTIRAAVVAAEGKVFSVGGDLAHFAAAEDRAERMREVAGGLHEALRLFTSAPLPVVTAVHGVAAGGGVGLALAGDIVLAGPRAKFVLAYTAAGLSPDCGSTWILARRIGLARAMDLALTNRPVGAEDAERWGLVSRVVDTDDVLGEARKVAEELTTGARMALASTKQLLRAAVDSPFSAQLDREAEMIARLVDGSEAREGVDAFLTKRAPRFA